MNILVEKRDHIGRPTLHYPGSRVLSQTDDTLCIEAFFDFDLPGSYVNICNGDRVIEWFFTNRWYNIFEYHDVQDDHLKGWYCNITRPTSITTTQQGLVIMWDDLALDVFIYPDGRFLLLDEDEMDDLTLPADLTRHIWAAVDQLRALVDGRHAPFQNISTTPA